MTKPKQFPLKSRVRIPTQLSDPTSLVSFAEFEERRLRYFPQAEYGIILNVHEKGAVVSFEGVSLHDPEKVESHELGFPWEDLVPYFEHHDYVRVQAMHYYNGWQGHILGFSEETGNPILKIGEVSPRNLVLVHGPDDLTDKEFDEFALRYLPATLNVDGQRYHLYSGKMLSGGYRLRYHTGAHWELKPEERPNHSLADAIEDTPELTLQALIRSLGGDYSERFSILGGEPNPLNHLVGVFSKMAPDLQRLALAWFQNPNPAETYELFLNPLRTGTYEPGVDVISESTDG
jgi:hypothetical protein